MFELPITLLHNVAIEFIQRFYRIVQYHHSCLVTGSFFPNVFLVTSNSNLKVLLTFLSWLTTFYCYLTVCAFVVETHCKQQVEAFNCRRLLHCCSATFQAAVHIKAAQLCNDG